MMRISWMEVHLLLFALLITPAFSEPAGRPAPPPSGVQRTTAAPLAPQQAPAADAGNRVLFEESLAGTEVGEFPRSLRLGHGSMEVVEIVGARYLQSSGNGYFVIELPEELPARFSFEADVLPHHGTDWGEPMLVFAPLPMGFNAGQSYRIRDWLNEPGAFGRVSFSDRKVSYTVRWDESGREPPDAMRAGVYRLRVLADSTKLRIFANDLLIANVPEANLGRCRRIIVLFNAYASEPSLIGNIRVAVYDGAGSGAGTQPAQPDQAVQPGDPAISHPNATGQVAFVSNRDGNHEIYVINADGTGLRNVSNHEADDVQPQWSPDGSRIVFVSYRDGKGEIFVVDADGTGLRNLSNHPAADLDPNWSPDGRRIAFSSNRGDGLSRIYVVNTDGTDLRNLSDAVSGRPHPPSDYYPIWSPKGDAVAFRSTYAEAWYIYAVRHDGSRYWNLTHPEARPNYGPISWSPDGTRIAFTGEDQIYVVNRDGRELRNLSNHPTSYSYLRWSPDGSRIAFETSRDGNREIHVIGVDGTGLRNLSNHATADGTPEWSPDARKIAFVSARDFGYMQIIVVNADGAGLRNVTNNYSEHRSPQWSPDGGWITFQRDVAGTTEIFVINADGTGLRNLSNHAGWDRDPVWRPK